MTNSNEVDKWFADRGDYTHSINYNLTEDSVIIDVGGYLGIWAQKIIDKYNPNVYILEPIPEFYEKMLIKFSNNNKVHLLNVGVHTRNINGVIFKNEDGCSSNLTQGDLIDVEFNTIDTILEKWGLTNVDLIQINIEGDEYPLIENMLETGSINRFENIQVQFHFGIENCIERRNKIREGLIKNGFKVNYDYPFVWESWYK